jgi:hypothetical protein
MTLTGQKARSVFERYNIVGQGDLFEAAGKLDDAEQQTGREDRNGAKAV